MLQHYLLDVNKTCFKSCEHGDIYLFNFKRTSLRYKRHFVSLLLTFVDDQAFIVLLFIVSNLPHFEQIASKVLPKLLSEWNVKSAASFFIIRVQNSDELSLKRFKWWKIKTILPPKPIYLLWYFSLLQPSPNLW